MPLISKTISNLIGGISQQAAGIRLEGQCENSVNGITSLVEGWKKRKGTKYVNTISGNINSATNYFFTDRELVTVTNGTVRVFGLDGAEKTVIKQTDGTSYLNTSDLIFSNVADTIFLLNSHVTPQMDSAVHVNPYAGYSIIHVKQVNWDTTYKITDPIMTIAVTSPDGVDDPNATGDETDADPKWLDFSYIASQLILAIPGAISCKNVILIPPSSNITSVSDSQNGQYLVYIKDKVSLFSDLPIVAPNGFVVEVANGTSSSSGNYFVKAVTTTGASIGDCYWEECAKPGLTKSIKASTMPHKLLRNTNGTYTLSLADWGDREVGDEYSNPEPTFIGKPINDVFYYKNRLGFLSGESLILSRASEPFDFFMSTVQTLADNEPIDAAGSHHTTVILKHALPLSERLYLFGEKAQFRLDEGDSILSPKTASITTLTEYETDTAVSPVSSGKSIFFPSKNLSWEGVYEGLITDDNFRADSVTSHVSALVPSNINIFTASPNAEMLIIHSKNTPSSLYLYKHAWNGNEKVQSAWTLQTFTGEIKAASFNNTTLNMVVYYAGAYYLESLNFDEGNITTEICLDRRITSSAASMNSATNVLTLPYLVNSDNLPVVLLKNGDVVRTTLQAGTTTATNTVIPIKPVSATDITAIGLRYDAVLEPSEIVFVPTGQKIALTQGRLQLKNFWLNFSNADTFTIHVTPLYRDTQIGRFQGIVGAGESILGKRFVSDGKYSVPIMSRNTQTKIEIHSDSVKQLCLINGGWEGYYVCRSTPS